MKKSFKDNPALQFLSVQPPPAVPPPAERRQRRVQLVWQPSLYARVQAAAQAQGLSVNAFVHQILDGAIPKD